MIHSLDLYSLRLSSTLASLAFGVVFAVLWRGRREDAYLLHWSASSLLYAGDLMAFQWAGHPPLALGCGLYAMLSVVNILAVSGMRQIEGRRPFAPWMAVVVTVTIACYGLPVLARTHWPSLSPSSVPIARAVGLSLSMLVVGIACIQCGRRLSSRGGVITGAALIGYIPGYAVAIAGELGFHNGDSWLALIPILSDQLLLGVLNLGLLAIPVERAQAALREAALRDPLTGCWNRAGLSKQSLSFARSGAAVVAIDIDHFKQLNDRFGHAAGDRALVRLSHAAIALAQPLGGEVARLGGDEFAVLLPMRSDLEAPKFASDLKQVLTEIEGDTCWTISAGFSSTDAGEDDCSAALERADDSLYRAKRQRRDRGAA
jgi:diguanylate cyclase (GGDEF)-like protein